MPVTDRLSPPEIAAPVPDCAEVVLVSGFTAGAEVHIFANGNERIGAATPYIGWWHVPLVRPVTTADTLTAIQEVGDDESFPTRTPVPVIARGPEIDPFLAPRIETPLYHCQQSVNVSNTVRGTLVEVFDVNDASVPRPALGGTWTPVEAAHVGTRKLTAGIGVFAVQQACRGMQSPPSAPPVPVQPLLSSLPPPQPRDPLVGATAIIFDNVVTGAEVEILLGETRVGGGIATSSSVIFAIPPVQPGDRHQARQSLCQLKSDRSPEATPITALLAPIIEEPICDGSSAVHVSNLIFGTIVKLFVNGDQAGQLSSTGPEATIVIGDQRFLRSGDEIVVTQETPAILRMASTSVTVSGPGGVGRPRVLEGHPFLRARPGEQPISGPVFARGTANSAGPGPTITFALCGAERVDVAIKPPGDRPPIPIKMVEKPEGHYRGTCVNRIGTLQSSSL